MSSLFPSFLGLAEKATTFITDGWTAYNKNYRLCDLRSHLG
jgi:hypothetical protein